jgi:hypothetical protein
LEVSGRLHDHAALPRCPLDRGFGWAPEPVWTIFKKNPWTESASELYRPSDRLLSTKLVATVADRWCQEVSSTTNPYGRYSRFSRLNPLLFLSSSSSIVLTRLNVPRSRPTTNQKIW